MRKEQDYLLKSDFKTKNLRKLSTPKTSNLISEFSQSYYSTVTPPQNSIKAKNKSTRSNKNPKEYNALIKKFNDFYERCDYEEYLEKNQTNVMREKIGYFKKEIKDLRKMTEEKKMKNFEEGNEKLEGNFQNFKNQTKFKKKIIDILISPIKNKQDLLFTYKKNQEIKNYVVKSLEISKK